MWAARSTGRDRCPLSGTKRHPLDRFSEVCNEWYFQSVIFFCPLLGGSVMSGPSMHVFTTRGSEPTYSSNRHDISICCQFVALYFPILRSTLYTTFQQPHLVLFDFCFLFSFCFTLPLLKNISRIYVRRKVRIRTIFRKPRILALLRKSSDRVLRKRRPRVAIFYIFSTLSASGRFASKGSFVSFLVCFRARYYCTLRSWASRNKEPRLLS